MKTPSLGKILLKGAAALFLALCLFSAAAALIAGGAEYMEEKYDAAWKVSGCERYAQERDYGGLYGYLTLYDLYGEPYEPYWELVNGFRDLQDFWMWNRAGEAGEAPESLAAELAEKVRQNAGGCRFPQNRRILEGFAREIDGEAPAEG